MPRLARGSVAQMQEINRLFLLLSRVAGGGRPPAYYLKAVRVKLRMSQAQLARRSGIGQAQVARIELGKIAPSLGTLRRLFDAMSCDLWVIPRPRRRLEDAVGERRCDDCVRDGRRNVWSDAPPIRLKNPADEVYSGPSWEAFRLAMKLIKLDRPFS